LVNLLERNCVVLAHGCQRWETICCLVYGARITDSGHNMV
jgi:hypothetical protein